MTKRQLSNAMKAVEKSKVAVESLLNSLEPNDNYRMGLLGPILSDLRQAEQTIKNLTGEK